MFRNLSPSWDIFYNKPSSYYYNYPRSYFQGYSLDPFYQRSYYDQDYYRPRSYYYDYHDYLPYYDSEPFSYGTSFQDMYSEPSTTATTSTAAPEMFLVTGDTTTDRLKLWRWETRELVVLLSLESSIGKVFNKNPLDTGCRYFSTAGRTDSVADIGSKGWSEFRHYNYGAVPYFGSSDNYHNLNKMLRNQNWKEGRTF